MLSDRKQLPSMVVAPIMFDQVMRPEELVADAVIRMMTDQEPAEKRPAHAFRRIAEIKFFRVPTEVTNKIEDIQNCIFTPRQVAGRGIVLFRKRLKQEDVEKVALMMVDLLNYVRQHCRNKRIRLRVPLMTRNDSQPRQEP